MNLFLLELYDKLYWERRRVSLRSTYLLDPPSPISEDYSHFQTPVTASGANTRPVQAGVFLSGLFRRLGLLIHHLQARNFSPRRRKLSRRKWLLVSSGLFFSWWLFHNHVFNALSKFCWGLYKHTHIRAIYVIDKWIIWPAWYFWNEKVFDPLTYQVWWPIKFYFRHFSYKGHAFDVIQIIPALLFLVIIKKWRKQQERE